MAESPQNARYRQIRSADRHGSANDKKVQMSDGTGAPGHLSKFLASGALTDNGIALASAPDTGSANAYGLTLTPAITPGVGDILVFKVASTNNAASTITLNGSTTATVKKMQRGSLADLAANDWTTGQMVQVWFDGTYWQWLSGGLADSLIGSGGSAAGVFPHGSWYGQVPRGTVDGANTVFTLDYTLASPFTILMVNGIGEKPPRDGPNANPNPDYAISGATLTMRYPPKPTDWFYIWYFAGEPVTLSASVSVTLYLTTAHDPSPTFSPNFGASATLDGVGLIFPVPSWFHSNGQWDTKTDSTGLDAARWTSLQDGSGFVMAMLEQATGIGSWPACDPPDEYRIYDCFVKVTKSDGSFEIWRPTTSSILEDAPGSEVLNPELAYDGDPTTYARLRVSQYGGFLNGAWLNMRTFRKVSGTGGSVDAINGGGNTSSGPTSSTGTTAAADQIYADMASGNEGTPHGSSYSGPVKTSLPSGTQALEWWSNLYVDASGNPATNTRVAVKNVQMWWFNTALGQWVNGFGPTNVFDGGNYLENLSGTQLSPISFSTESDGSRAYGTTQGQVAHSFTPYPRVSIDPTTYGGMVVIAEAKLVLINPTGTDDRASAKLLYDVGADPYASTTNGVATPPATLASGRMKYVTTNWRSFAATDMTQAALEATPPPIDLTGIDP